MRCPGCEAEVAETQKFCAECGIPLRQVAPDLPATTIDVDLPTQPVTVLMEPPSTPPLTEPGTLQQPPTEPIPIDQPPTEPFGIAALTDLATPTEIATTDVATTHAATAEITTTTVPTTVPTTTEELPAIFDGSSDLAEYPTPREPFRVRIVFILSLFGVAAVLMSMVADVIDIRTTRPTAGIGTGIRTLDDLGTNLGLSAFAGAAVMVLGSLLACFGLRWGAGLAAGAGAALAGWAGLTIGLAELPIAIAESITRTSSEEFTLRVTRDIGWWLIAGVGVIGVLVLISSLRFFGTGARPALNPLLAALTAVATVIVGMGPLVPVGSSASFADNFRSTDPNSDLPAAFFAGRLGQVGLIIAAGVVGMLIVRSYGLGLAAGAVSVATAMWVTSLIQFGDRPIGIADRNPGATSTEPHAVTTVGMISTLALLVIAAAFATYRLTRRRPA